MVPMVRPPSHLAPPLHTHVHMQQVTEGDVAHLYIACDSGCSCPATVFVIAAMFYLAVYHHQAESFNTFQTFILLLAVVVVVVVTVVVQSIALVSSYNRLSFAEASCCYWLRPL